MKRAQASPHRFGLHTESRFKMKKQLLVGLAAGVAVLGTSAFAGEETEGPKPQMFAIYKDVVIPSKTQEYETALKYMISEFKAYGIDPELVNFKVVSGPEFGYVFVIPIENFAAIDRMQENWKAASEIIGEEKFTDMMQSMESAIDHVDAFHIMYRPGLSYAPENPSLKPDEAEYVHYSFYYVTLGKKKQFEELAKEFAELYKSKNIDTGWSIYESVTGSDLPVFVIAHASRSQGEYYSRRDEVRELLGEAGEKLVEKALTLVRRIEHKDGWTRPDLSYPGQETDKR